MDNQFSNPSYMPFGTPANIQSGTNDNIQGVRWVANIEEVRASSVPYGYRSLFLDNNNPIMYLKDYNGNVRQFSIKEIEQPKPENFVTKQELEEVKRSYESIIDEFRATIAQYTAQPTTDVTAAQYNTGASNTGVLQPSSSNEPNQTTSGTVA